MEKSQETENEKRDANSNSEPTPQIMIINAIFNAI